jgi:hypothetical protein
LTFLNSKVPLCPIGVVNKRAIILLSFLAYSVTLVHSFVPHHHHEGAKIGQHHHHGNKTDHHHHHHEEHEGNQSLSHVFADAIHHPASEVALHTAQTENVQKKNGSVDVIIFKIRQPIFPELKPPDIPIHYQEKHHSSQQDSFFLLRGPPVA